MTFMFSVNFIEHFPPYIIVPTTFLVITTLFSRTLLLYTYILYIYTYDFYVKEATVDEKCSF